MFGSHENPLRDDSAATWNRLIEAINPPSLLVVITGRMSATLKRRLTPEDVWQEVLLHVWRDRLRVEWRGLRGFRNWVLSVIDHRIRDLADQATAQKRGGGTVPLSLQAPASDSTTGDMPLIDSTTPSRLAALREQAEAMRQALDALPPELRDPVRIRLFEQRTAEETAATLQLTVAAVRHRFRRGLELYQRTLQGLLSIPSRSTTDSAPAAGRNSSPVNDGS